MRYYEPDVANINTVLEAGVYQQFLTGAIQRIHLFKAKFLGNQLAQNPDNVEGNSAPIVIEDSTSASNNSIHEIPQNGNADDNNNVGEDEGSPSSLPGGGGPHLCLSFLESQTKWNTDPSVGDV
ncbi:uncharacterized protein LOC127240596 [Andrographis paniculata]|uniref:uncharacterized protein LOC127240596 n=1 Tax=Andrographis paniculata TaxID=175694 RepID=UPI0021E7AF6B|nr:uncharacterized protein LOC127240596 [Andrographis paniculata]